MIRGYFRGVPGRRRPFVVGHVRIATARITRDVHFLIDTGADSTLVSSVDVSALGLDIRSLPRVASIGVGGRVAMAVASATLLFGSVAVDVAVPIWRGDLFNNAVTAAVEDA